MLGTGVCFYIQRGDFDMIEIEKFKTIRENGLKYGELIIIA